MGLLDSVLGQVLGGQDAPRSSGAASGAGGLAAILGGLLANDGGQGGLGGLVSKFERAGMGDVIGSWIGKGENAPVSGGQLGQALGEDTVSGLAQKLGINAATLLPLLASLLPLLIDRLTPQGRVPEQGLGSLEDLNAQAGSPGGLGGLGDLGGILGRLGGQERPAGDGAAAAPDSQSELLASLSALLQKR